MSRLVINACSGLSVGRRADELLKGRVDTFVRQFLTGRGLGDAEIDHRGHGLSVIDRDEVCSDGFRSR